MRLVLHIGTEKTGSTALQTCLRANRELLEGHGFAQFVMPGEIERHQLNNRQFAAAFAPFRIRDDYLQDYDLSSEEKLADYRAKVFQAFEAFLADLPAHIHTVLLSSEHLHSRVNDARHVAKLGAYLKPLFDDIVIIAYLREQSSLCRSYYFTAVRGGDPSSFEHFKTGCMTYSPYYNYEMFLGFWARAFDQSKLIVRLYNKSDLCGGDIRTDFLSLLSEYAEIDTSHFTFAKQSQNSSFGPVRMAMLKMLNKICPVDPDDRAKNYVRPRLLSYLERLPVLDVISENGNDDEIYERFESSNCQLAQVYLGRDENPFKR